MKQASIVVSGNPKIPVLAQRKSPAMLPPVLVLQGTHMKYFIVILCLTLAACGSPKSPTTPSPTPTPTATRIISVEGAMDFGGVTLNQSKTNILTIRNSGTAPLTISGITGSGGITAVTALSWTSGTIAAGGLQDVNVRFTPSAIQGYSGTITVNGDQTAGTNTIAFAGSGTLTGIPVFSKSGTGDQVFDLPSYVTRLRIQASPATSCQNFVVKVKGSLLVNIILGTCSVADAKSIDNTYAISGGGTVTTEISTGINWTMTEVR